MSEQPQAGTAETEAERDERLRHGSTFGAVAEAYASHRPGYPAAAVRWALAPVWSGNGTPPRVVDLGAGTGKLTETLLDVGADVTAVEPDPAMLGELSRAMPGVRSVPGSAEDIPLPDGSADAVLAGQAMHWFDPDRALPEIARVLRPGGVLAGLWNVDDDRLEWVATLAEMSKRKASVTLTRWRGGETQTALSRRLDDGTSLFLPAETGEFENGQEHTADSLVANIATHSHLLVMSEPDRAALLGQVREFLGTQPQTSAGPFTLPMLTVGLRAQRR